MPALRPPCCSKDARLPRFHVAGSEERSKSERRKKVSGGKKRERRKKVSGGKKESGGKKLSGEKKNEGLKKSEQ